MEATVGSPVIWPLVVYIAAVIAMVGAMVGLSALLGGSKKRTQATNEPFECGVVSYGSAHYRVPIPFFLFAIFFVIFDLEAVFLFSYAIAFREVGWPGYIEVLIFVGILVAALVYLWRLGALDWRTAKQIQQQSSYKK
ncbi:MAG: NAD(P)H-quinone oxidoreductase subunit 3 [Halieaceae bacterium]|jgi:NADH-quinone oxidoreductase subunit A|nr:NAD(P)H-quinone oxidoreductase subunit 3 [Halieaceae bacterium]